MARHSSDDPYYFRVKEPSNHTNVQRPSPLPSQRTLQPHKHPTTLTTPESRNLLTTQTSDDPHHSRVEEPLNHTNKTIHVRRPSPLPSQRAFRPQQTSNDLTTPESKSLPTTQTSNDPHHSRVEEPLNHTKCLKEASSRSV